MTVNKELPDYTKGEEIFNAVTHIVGAAFGIAALIIGVVFAVIYSDTYGIVSMGIYGTSLIVMFCMSSIYHFLRPNIAKKVFRILDHCTIFFLIAGTYTPICLILLRNSGAWGWALFSIVWGLAIIGATLNAVMMHRKSIKIFSMICYILMGWCVIIAIVPLLKVLQFEGFMWLLGGGIAYTLGAVLYLFGSKVRYFHSVWHIFILIGSALQYIAILLYAVIS